MIKPEQNVGAPGPKPFTGLPTPAEPGRLCWKCRAPATLKAPGRAHGPNVPLGETYCSTCWLTIAHLYESAE